MTRPNLTWAAYNLFRIGAVVFICWTLVAQFIALAEDMDAVSQAVLLRDHWTGTANADETETTTSTTASPGWTAIGTLSSPFNVKTAAIPLPSVPVGSSATVSLASPVTPTDGTTSTVLGGGHNAPRRAFFARSIRASDATKLYKRDGISIELDEGPEDEYVAGSGVPVQPGGGAFVVIGRIVMACLLGLTALAQIRLPETFLYEKLAWIGPQSTPLWLGILEFLLATENLRVYTRADLLIGSWGLLGFGAANILLGLLLLWLGRRMPKQPPAPLYFSRSTRLLFFRPEPAFYGQLDKKPKKALVDYQEDVEKAPVPRALPPSNAREIGLDDPAFDNDHNNHDNDREPEWKMVTPPSRVAKRDEVDPRDRHIPRPSKTKKKSKSPQGVAAGLQSTIGNQVLPVVARPKPSQDMINPEHDVTQGGYPTFAAGGGLNDPRRQVPTGVVEQSSDGRAFRFMKEDGREAGLTGPNVDFAGAGPIRNVPIEQTVAANKARRAEKDAPNKPSVLARLPDLAHDSADTTGTQTKTQRKSSLDAAAELASRFPAPPSRSNSGGKTQQDSKRAPNSGLAVNTNTATVPASRAARLKELLSPTTTKPTAALSMPASLAQTEASEPIANGGTSDAELVVQMSEEPEEYDDVDSPAVTPGSTASKSPFTPVMSARQHTATVVKLSSAKSRSVNTGPSAEEANMRENTHHLTGEDLTPATAPEPAPGAASGDGSTTSAVADSARRPVARQSSLRRSSESHGPSKGVRFDLSCVEEVTEPESSPSPPMSSAVVTSPPTTGLRIPGTNFRLALPFGSPSPAATTASDWAARDSKRISTSTFASFGLASAADTDGFYTPGSSNRPPLSARESSDTLGSTSQTGSRPARPQSALIASGAVAQDFESHRPRRPSSASYS